MDAWAGFNMGETVEQNGKAPRHVDPTATPDQRTYALFMHLTTIIAAIWVPVAPVLVMWLVKRQESHFIDDHGKEALNFQISLLIYFCASLVLTFCGIGVVGIIGSYVLGIVGMVMAASAANRGEYFRYPATIRFIS